MNVSESDSSLSSETSSISDNDKQPLDFSFTTRIPVESYKFKWIVNQPCSLSINNELYSPYVCQLRLFSCRLKLIKYENGFGLFHVYETRHDKTVNNPMTVASGSTSVNNLENTLPCSEKDNSDKYPCPRVIEYQVSVVDIYEKERVKWTTCFSNKNDNECFPIGEYRSNSLKTFFNDVLVLLCRMKVIKKPETENWFLSNDSSLEMLSLKTLSQNLQSMYENCIVPNFVLKVETNGILVNSCILSARSSVFKNIIQTCKSNRINFVEITGVQLSTVTKFVEFLYTGIFEAVAKYIIFEELCDLYSLANQYQVLDLQKLCGALLLSKTLMNEISLVLLLANEHNDMNLKSQVLNFIRLNFEAFQDSSAWRFFREKDIKLANEVLSFCIQKFNGGVDK